MSDQLLRGWLAVAEQTGESPDFHVRRKVDKRDRYGTPLKWRIVHEPNEAMTALHQEVIAWLERVMPQMSHAVGGVKGISTRKGLARHGNNQYGYRVDIKDAYNAVDIAVLTEILWRLSTGEPLNVPVESWSATDLFDPYSEFQAFATRYLANRRGNGMGLAYGAPASVILFNLYVHVQLDQVLGPWCQKRGMKMTRYLDDILITSNVPISRKQRRAIREMIDSARFTRSQGKPRRKEFCFDLQKGSVVAIGMNMQLNQHGVRIRMKPEEAEQLRKALKHGIKHPRKADHDWIAGRIGMLKSSLPPGYQDIEQRWARGKKQLSPEQLVRQRWNQLKSEHELAPGESQRDLYLMRSEIELLQLWHQYRGRRRRSLRALRR